MPEEQQKWASQHGHAIASSETDKFTKLMEEHNEIDLLAEAVKLIEDCVGFHEMGVSLPLGYYARARDFLAKIER